MRDWLSPLNNGTVPVETLQVSSNQSMPVENGQCLIDSLEMNTFTALPWWVTFRNFMDAVVQEEAGLPDSEKLIKGNVAT